MIIAVDFDGTIVQHKYPAIGEDIPFAIESLKQLQKEGHQLILWTYRTGDLLQEAVEYCQEKGLEFYAVNQSYPEEDFDASVSRKIYADLYIDDRNIGGIPQWGNIYKMISGKKQVNENFTPKKSSFTRFLEQIFKD